MTVRVLVADDQEMVRAGFALILQAQPDLEVVATCADGVEAVETARRLQPDVVLVDIRMPRLDGLAVTRALAGPEQAGRCAVVVVTTFDDDEYLDTALTSGAAGFLLKDAGPALLVESVRAAARGDMLISPSLVADLLRRRPGVTPGLAPAGTALTGRELEVVRLVAHGATNVEVANALFVSLATVKSHLTNVQDKLGVANRVQVAAWAWRHRVVN